MVPLCPLLTKWRISSTLDFSMIQTVVNAKNARDNFSDILGRVKFGEETVIVEKNGKPAAVMISPEQYEAFRKEARRHFGEVVRRVQSRNTQFSADEVEKDVKREVEAARTELYEHGE